MLNKEHRSNVMMTWLYRGIGWCASFIGFFVLTNLGKCLGQSVLPVHLLHKYPLLLIDDFPIIREIVNCGLLIANLLLASSVTLISIAIGWLWYRPLIAIALLCLAVAPFLVIKQRARNLKSN